MSNGGTTMLALALGAGGGFLLWHLLDDDDTNDGKQKPGGGAAPAAMPPDAPAGSPPRLPGPCSLKLDALALTLDGVAVDVPTAVSRCKVAGKAELAYAGSGPAAVFAELTSALHKAGVPVTVKAP